MVQALLDGRKTMTRRIVKPQPEGMDLSAGSYNTHLEGFGVCSNQVKCPFGKVGDLLYVREKLECANGEALGYPADGTWFPNDPWIWKRKTLPSIHMSRHYSRLTLEITDIRVERLQDISALDAMQEGIDVPPPSGADVTNVSMPEGYNEMSKKRQEQLLKDTSRAVYFARCIDTDNQVVAFKELWESINGLNSWEKNPWVWVIKFKVHKCNVDKFLSNAHIEALN